MSHRDHLVGTSRLVVRVATVVNRLFLLALVLALLLSWIFAEPVAWFLIHAIPGGPPSVEVTGLRLLVCVGIVMALATDRLLVALGQIIASARAGDPFVAAYARRLRTVGWSLLVLQLLDIPCLLLDRLFPSLGPAAPDGGISVGGWVAVLMVFVLSHVFATGSVMRDELRATV